MSKTAVIIGAGPAGLTAAYELLTRTDIKPIIIEQSSYVGGISCTLSHHGNRIDLGGHRFFSKSERVISWWLKFLPLEKIADHNKDIKLTYRNSNHLLNTSSEGLDPNLNEKVMLIRKRHSRILYQEKFYDYPPSLSLSTLRSLGRRKTFKIILTYLKSKLSPIRDEKSLEDFMINRFGSELYKLFFKSYSEKVWGKQCSEISSDWGRQRIKGVSLSKILLHPFRSLRKDTETSLTEWFLYPKYGPGQMWETVAAEVQKMGGVILNKHSLTSFKHDGQKVTSITAKDQHGNSKDFQCNILFSSMPLSTLLSCANPQPNTRVLEVSNGLQYRHFITVGILTKKLSLFGGVDANTLAERLPDNWLYIHEPTVKLGRVQVFNNWSPYLIKDKELVWLGLEYFCGDDDELWDLSEEEIKALAILEAEKINLFCEVDVIDSIAIKVPKAYPGYFGTYNQIDTLKSFCETLTNLYPIGRNGMHRYNNQDHSMLTAMVAVDNIIQERSDKDNIWKVNTEDKYQEGI